MIKWSSFILVVLSFFKERWQSKQQEKKMEALQEALLHEQRIAMDKLTRERTDIDRSKVIYQMDSLLKKIHQWLEN